MRKAAQSDILFPLKFSCMGYHSSNLDTGKTARCFESFVSVVDEGGTAEGKEGSSHNRERGQSKING